MTVCSSDFNSFKIAILQGTTFVGLPVTLVCLIAELALLSKQVLAQFYLLAFYLVLM